MGKVETIYKSNNSLEEPFKELGNVVNQRKNKENITLFPASSVEIVPSVGIMRICSITERAEAQEEIITIYKYGIFSV